MRFRTTALIAVFAALAAPVRSQTVVAQDEILLGMSAPLSGPSEALGVGMRAGILAALEEANRAGGVHGRKLRLIALDDGYEPSRCAPNMHRLVDDEKVAAVVGNVGTPTAVVAIPIAIGSATPFVGAFTGAGVLRRTPPDKCVINFRASYAEEVGAMVDALVDRAGIKPQEIAFFTQRDAYGDAGYAGGIAALKRRGLTDESVIAHGRYERNTEAVENGLADIMTPRVPARAVIMVGAYKPCARFIRMARQQQLRATFLNVSFVGSGPLAKELGSDGDGVIITQVVPHFAADLPLTRQYRAALAAADPNAGPGFGSLEGYAVMRMLLLSLDRIPDKPDRSSIVSSLEGLGSFDLGMGSPLELSPIEHQACHQVWPTVIREGAVVAAGWDELFGKSHAEAP